MADDTEIDALKARLDAIRRSVQDRREYLEGWRKSEGQAPDASGTPGAPVAVMADADDPFQAGIQEEINFIEAEIRRLERGPDRR